MAREDRERRGDGTGLAVAAGAAALGLGAVAAWWFFGRKPECPAGQHYDDTAKACVPDGGGGCPAGQHSDGTKCVPDVLAKCAGCPGVIAFSSGAVPQSVCFSTDRPNFMDIGGRAYALRFCDPKIAYARLYYDAGFANFIRDVTPADGVPDGEGGLFVPIIGGAGSILLPSPPPAGSCASQGGTCMNLDTCINQGKTCVNSTDCTRCCCVTRIAANGRRDLVFSLNGPPSPAAPPNPALQWVRTYAPLRDPDVVDPRDRPRTWWS